ncbi:MAG: DUF1491 family protein [Hyphomicrobiaceae bacterium]|nr:DUF1491 family protein [Hyphomicrobiaceae bacterium]
MVEAGKYAWLTAAVAGTGRWQWTPLMRLKSEFWVKAYVRSAASAGASAFVVRRGDADSGAIFIRVNRLDGTSTVFGPAVAGLDETSLERRFSARLAQGGADDDVVEAYLAGEMRYDPDAWIIEIEDRQARHFLGDWLAPD